MTSLALLFAALVLPLRPPVPGPAETVVERGTAALPDRSITGVVNPTVTVYLPPGGGTGAGILICPGGGYNHLAIDKEGHEVARWLATLGVAGFVLEYRLPPSDSPDAQARHDDPDAAARFAAIPVADATAALRLLRKRAAEFGLRTDRIGIMGFSAGGNLAALIATRAPRDARPSFAALIYPGLPGGLKADGLTPPCFLAQANDDPFASVDHTVQFCLALRSAKVPAELHLYANGGHGFGIRKQDTDSDAWPEAFAGWLRARHLLGGQRDAYAARTEAAQAANAAPVADSEKGPFRPTWDSLQHYTVPEWFRDAKFGIWAHWGPQCQPEMGDWYARFMYVPHNPKPWGQHDYEFHVARYGPPSTFGFKDVIRTWRAEHWDPEKLMALYKRAGAQYFMALANHHDNFDLWDSRYQPWNSMAVGPHKDIVAGWAKAARGAGLRFAVSVHAARAWSWYQPAQGADEAGPYAHVPYDGNLTAADGKGLWWDGLDPQDLYAQNHPVTGPDLDVKLDPPARGPADPRLPSPAYIRKFYNRVIDLIDHYDPDLVYFDDRVLPFYGQSDVGLKIAAHLYNRSYAEHGRVEAVLTGKRLDDLQRRCIVYDIERGRSPDILPTPWQTDTCIGEWHYDRALYDRDGYKTATEVVQMLADIVSKNGNLMLNVPLRGDGTIDDEELRTVKGIAAWMDVNHEAIFATRPWKVYGEGPSTVGPQEAGGLGGIKDVGRFTARDVRYTVSKAGEVVYAIVLGRPDGDVRLAALGRNAGRLGRPIRGIRALGQSGEVRWSQDDGGATLSAADWNVIAGALVFRIELGS